MNARTAILESKKLVQELIDSSASMSNRMGKEVVECIDYKIDRYVKKASTANEAIAWKLRGEEAKQKVAGNNFTVVFNNDEDSNDKEFSISFDAAVDYVFKNNGTNESYFADYKTGTVSIMNNDTNEYVYEQKVI